ncbi:MAG TPA: hypothetical protein VNE38_15755 [Ktedonobacteraceae bacterium]|nr:hypothetical protein [Ktedonobacteraceae bacterium]
MAKVNRPGARKPATGTGNTKAKQQEAAKITVTQAPVSPPLSSQDAAARGKQGSKARRTAIGGTAVPGARSMRPKEMPTSQNASSQEQADTYNRDMRRRMQHMGTGPYSEPAPVPARKKAQKRLDERKKRQEEVKKTVVSKGPSTDIKLGRRNTYFVLGALAFVVLVIVIALIVHRV